ncbi:hypothetical protein QFC22_001260 [Naganishia vaughanmartiniae]|uniref:Uncharacterized protein n=1 Tax=Naganishia vaughanmartiniae TaxID=1424756 RepID=A0ACC2XJ57_9TREE|nr:hypothetical protein QFC22_001260 [Naganishia vaughanmartiniae]
MQAVIYESPNVVKVVQKEIPHAGPGEAVVKVTTSGLCGSDLHIYRGHTPGIKQTGFTLGHEFCGTIHQLGPTLPGQAWSFKQNDRVVSPFTTSCGECFFCERDYTGRCVRGSVYGCEKLEGAQAEYVKVPLANTTLYKAPDELQDNHLILMADILPTGYSVAQKAWDLLSEKERKIGGLSALVIGCGPVGLCAIMAAKEKFETVYAIDPVAERRAMAERYGAKSLDPTSQDLKTTLKSLTNNRGPDVVLEVVGHPEALYTALELVRVTGVVSSCGVHIAPMELVGNDLYANGVKMCFGRCHVRGVFGESLGLLKRVTEATPQLIEEFVQKRIRIEDAVEVGSI